MSGEAKVKQKMSGEFVSRLLGKVLPQSADFRGFLFVEISSRYPGFYAKFLEKATRDAATDLVLYEYGADMVYGFLCSYLPNATTCALRELYAEGETKES